MNEREAEQADVRPFLPRPGEPVEEYAERLRAMHRDLSVVLQAVERGLQRAHGAEQEAVASAPAPPPPPPREVDEVRVASAAREPTAAALREGPLPGAPRVEVVSTRTGHRADDPTVDTPWAEAEPFVERRQPVRPVEHHRVSPRPDEPRWEHAVPAPSFASRPSADPLHAPPPPVQPPLAERPSADPRYAEARVADRASAPVAVTQPPPRPPVPEPVAPPPARVAAWPPWLVTAVLAGWLTIVALLLALLLDG